MLSSPFSLSVQDVLIQPERLEDDESSGAREAAPQSVPPLHSSQIRKVRKSANTLRDDPSQGKDTSAVQLFTSRGGMENQDNSARPPLAKQWEDTYLNSGVPDVLRKIAFSPL